MIREWLLIVWLGTSTNFTIQGVFWNTEDCTKALNDTKQQLGADFVVVCTQNMQEGRSLLPARSGSNGLVK
jgi:hypothetical protein